MKVGVLALSSVVPKYQLKQGLELLDKNGFRSQVAPQVRKSHFIFAGDHEERADALIKMALDPKIEVIFCSRGGYGSYHLLPLLEKKTRKLKIPKGKLLIGFSDVTPILEYVSKKWGWSVLHGPMPATQSFNENPKKEKDLLFQWIEKGMTVDPVWQKRRLKLITRGKGGAKKIEATLTGGNLSLVTAMMGTPYELRLKNRILFLEEYGETISRLDRMAAQLRLNPQARHLKAIVLGAFEACRDSVPEFPNAQGALTPLRRKFGLDRGLKEIFGSLGDDLEIPVFSGLPVGHGPTTSMLPLDAQYRLSKDGSFELLKWKFLK